ncbi:MAG: peptidoglycan-binding protein [Actinomycetota bacterium]
MSTVTDPTPGDASPEAPVPYSGAAPTTPAASTQAEPVRSGSDYLPPDRRRPRWPLAVVAVGVAMVGAAGVYALWPDGTDSADGEAPATIRAVVAEQRDLIEYTTLDGTLTFADVRTVAAPGAGTVTAVADDGANLSRGDMVYEIDADAVVLFYGDVPFYRPLTEGDEGADVEQLEANLASLGYHIEPVDDGEDEIDTGFTVDGVYDAATTEAVTRMQADLDRDETGDLALGSVVVAPGPSVASSIQAEVGQLVQAGSPILALNVTGDVDGFYSSAAGEVELVASAGAVASGAVLYTVDEQPVTAIVTDEEFDRDLSDGVADGDDVRALEEMLVALGYDARGDLEPDDEFDEVTVEAIDAWEEDLQDDYDDVVVDGAVTLDEIVVVDPGTTIGTVTARDSEVVASGSELFTWSGDTGARVVTAAIDVAEQEKLAEGNEIEVEFPDGEIVVGTVTDVATSSTVDPTDPDATPQLAVEIALPSIPESAAGFNELDVDLRIVDDLAAGVTVVPASALVATSDGGYAVETTDGVTTTFVAVEPGMFADGFVEVSGIDPGTAVVVPS